MSVKTSVNIPNEIYNEAKKLSEQLQPYSSGGS